MTFFSAFGIILLAAALGGGTAGLTGLLLTGLRMPFLAISSAHAAMAGAVFGQVLGERLGLPVPEQVAAFAGALAGAGLLSWLLRHRREDPNAALGVMFSLMLGLTFLGIGLLREGPKSEAFALLWGNLLFVTFGQVALMAAVAAALGTFSYSFRRQIKVLLFSRQMAAALIPENMILALLLVITAGVITINLRTVGGLLMFSLLSNPAVAALRLARSYRAALLLSVMFGALSAVGGFFTAWLLDLPAGACIVLFSCAVAAAAALIGGRTARTRRFFG